MFKVIAAVAALTLVAGPAAAQPAAEPNVQVSADKIRAHMTFLASDLLEGREAGTRGYDIAANYAAAQFAQLGLQPAGDAGTYFQTVPLVAYRAADQGELRLTVQGRTEALAAGSDFVTGRNPLQAETRVSAPLVFVGYGVVAPERAATTTGAST